MIWASCFHAAELYKQTPQTDTTAVATPCVFHQQLGWCLAHEPATVQPVQWEFVRRVELQLKEAAVHLLSPYGWQRYVYD